jgi:thiamine-monophosphate kinase
VGFETELIKLVRNAADRDSPDWPAVGPGDDAAAVELEHAETLVVTTDMVVEGVHFTPETPSAAVAHKAMARCISDLAAMAARPLCSVAALKMGQETPESRHRELMEALPAAARELSAPLIGGDVGSGDGALVLTVTGIGVEGPAGLVRRNGARPGDAICVTGRLGGSIRGRHLDFRPRVKEALELVELADVHALIDISDGLSTDLLHIADESDVGVEVEAGRIPISPDAVELSRESGHTSLWHALNDGEDYELLFCLSPQEARQVEEHGLEGLEVTIIGRVTEDGNRYLISENGKRNQLHAEGWEHTTQ